jgi:prevent-host-death family protein
MTKRSLADARAHLSELVHAAEHQGKRTLILRHGKPAAAIVPVEVVARKPRRKRALPKAVATRSVHAFIAELSSLEPELSAVGDLIQGRR